jgi:hypothetical protein
MKVTIELDTENKMDVFDAYMTCEQLVRKAFPNLFRKGGVDDMDDLTKEGLVAKIKALRVETDALMNKVIDLRKTPANQLAGRNISIVFTHLEDAKMRLGKCLEDIGNEFPAELADKAERPA